MESPRSTAARQSLLPTTKSFLPPRNPLVPSPRGAANSVVESSEAVWLSRPPQIFTVGSTVLSSGLGRHGGSTTLTTVNGVTPLTEQGAARTVQRVGSASPRSLARLINTVSVASPGPAGRALMTTKTAPAIVSPKSATLTASKRLSRQQQQQAMSTLMVQQLRCIRNSPLISPVNVSTTNRNATHQEEQASASAMATIGEHRKPVSILAVGKSYTTVDSHVERQVSHRPLPESFVGSKNNDVEQSSPKTTSSGRARSENNPHHHLSTVNRVHSEPFGWQTVHNRQIKVESTRKLNETRSDKTFAVDNSAKVSLITQPGQPKSRFHANSAKTGHSSISQQRRTISPRAVFTGGRTNNETRHTTATVDSAIVESTPVRITAFRTRGPHVALPALSNGSVNQAVHSQRHTSGTSIPPVRSRTPSVVIARPAAPTSPGQQRHQSLAVKSPSTSPRQLRQHPVPVAVKSSSKSAKCKQRQPTAVKSSVTSVRSTRELQLIESALAERPTVSPSSRPATMTSLNASYEPTQHRQHELQTLNLKSQQQLNREQPEQQQQCVEDDETSEHALYGRVPDACLVSSHVADSSSDDMTCTSVSSHFVEQPDVDDLRRKFQRPTKCLPRTLAVRKTSNVPVDVGGNAVENQPVTKHQPQPQNAVQPPPFYDDAVRPKTAASVETVQSSMATVDERRSQTIDNDGRILRPWLYPARKVSSSVVDRSKITGVDLPSDVKNSLKALGAATKHSSVTLERNRQRQSPQQQRSVLRLSRSDLGWGASSKPKGSGLRRRRRLPTSTCTTSDSTFDEPVRTSRRRKHSQSTVPSRSLSELDRSSVQKRRMGSVDKGMRLSSSRTDVLVGRLSRVASYNSLIEAIGDAATRLNPLNPSSIFESLTRQFGKAELLEDDDSDFEYGHGFDITVDGVGGYGRRANRCSSNSGIVSGQRCIQTSFSTSQSADFEHDEQLSPPANGLFQTIAGSVTTSADCIGIANDTYKSSPANLQLQQLHENATDHRACYEVIRRRQQMLNEVKAMSEQLDRTQKINYVLFGLFMTLYSFVSVYWIYV